MKVNLKYENISITTIENYEDIKIGLEYLKESINERFDIINKLQKLIDDNLTAEEFYNLAIELYDVSIEKNDILQLGCNILKDKVFESEIRTSMIFDHVGNGPWNCTAYKWRKWFFLKAKVITGYKTFIDPSNRLSFVEIMKMIKNKKLILIDLELEDRIDNISGLQLAEANNRENLEELNNLKLSNINHSYEDYRLAITQLLLSVLKESKLDSDLKLIRIRTLTDLEKLKKQAVYNRNNYENKMNVYNELIDCCEEGEILKRML